jgi:hypothetical protein
MDLIGVIMLKERIPEELMGPPSINIFYRGTELNETSETWRSYWWYKILFE